MTCKPDNNLIFNDKQDDFCTKCEACGYFVKLRHYRSCQARIDWNLENGDKKILDSIYEANRLAQTMTGKPIEAIDGIEPLTANSSSSKSDKSKKQNKAKKQQRGRR